MPSATAWAHIVLSAITPRCPPASGRIEKVHRRLVAPAIRQARAVTCLVLVAGGRGSSSTCRGLAAHARALSTTARLARIGCNCSSLALAQCALRVKTKTKTKMY
jgi:hypothetical protein